MPSAKRVYKQRPYSNGKSTPVQPGDVGAWSRSQLVRMYNGFRARLLRAFKRGKESCQAAAATYDANHANVTGRPRPFGVPRDRPRDAVRHTVHYTVIEILAVQLDRQLLEEGLS